MARPQRPAPEKSKFQPSRVTIPSGLNDAQQRQFIEKIYGPDTGRPPRPDQKDRDKMLKLKAALYGGAPWQSGYDDNIVSMDLQSYRFGEYAQSVQVHNLVVPVLETALGEVSAFCRETGYRIYSMGGHSFRYAKNDNTNYIRDRADRREVIKWWMSLPEQEMPRKKVPNLDADQWNKNYMIVAAYYDRDFKHDPNLKDMPFSNHAWGVAIDVNAGTNDLHSLEFDMPPGIVAIMRKHGFFWGGYYSGHQIDTMHFEYLLDTIESRHVVFPLGTPKSAQHPPGYYALNECGDEGGYYPVTLSKCLHGGAHFEAPDAKAPVKALLPGYIVAARFIVPNSEGDAEVLREFMGQRLPGFVLLRHELADPQAAANPIVLYSLYMHLEPPAWDAPSADPCTVAAGKAKEGKKAKDAPDSAAEASWVQAFLRLRHGAVVNLDPSRDAGTAVGKTYWSTARVSGTETQFNVIGGAVLPAGDDAQPKAVAKPAPAAITKAIDAFKKGSVVTFSRPFLQVGAGDVLGFVTSVKARPGGRATAKDLHFELFSPAGPNGSPGTNGVAALVAKMPTDITSLIQAVSEPGAIANANNYLEMANGGPNEVAQILAAQNSTSAEAGTGMPQEGDPNRPPHVNTTEQQELQQILSDPDYEAPLRRFMQTGTFALRPRAARNDLKPDSSPQASSPPPRPEPGYWLKLSVDNPQSFTVPQDKSPIQVHVRFFRGDERVGDPWLLEIADANKRAYTILVPARADRMTFDSDDVILDELPLSGTDSYDSRVALFKALVPLHWRRLQLTHINEWTADGLDRLLTELNQKEPDRIAHLLKLLDQNPRDLPALQRALRPLAWWNRQCTANDPFGEVPAIGDSSSDSLFGSAAHQLPPDGGIENIHPVTGAWICDLAVQKNLVTATAKWDVPSLSTTPVYLSFVGVDAEVAVGQKVFAVLVLEGFGSSEGGSISLTRTDTSAPSPIVFEPLQVVEGTATIAPRFSFWGTWELSAKDKGGAALSPQKKPRLSLTATKPSPVGKLRILRSPLDDAFWAWASFREKAPLVLEGFLALQYAKTAGGEPPPDATWDCAKVALPVVALHGEEATSTVGGITIQNGFVVKAEKNARISKSYAFADFAKKAKDKPHFKVSYALCLRLEEFQTLLALRLNVSSVSEDGLVVAAGLENPTQANKKKLKEKAGSSEFPALASITHAVDDSTGRITFTQAAADPQELFFEFRPRFAIETLIKDLSLQPSDELYVRPCFLAPNGGHHHVDLKPLSEPGGPAIAFDRDAVLSRCNQDIVEVAGTLVFGPLKGTGVEPLAFKMSDTQLRVQAKLTGDLKQWEKSKPRIKLEVNGIARGEGTLKDGVLSADWTIAPGGKNDPGRWGKQLDFTVVLGNPAAFPVPPLLPKTSFAAVPTLDSFEVKRGEGTKLELRGKAHCVPPDKDLIIHCDKWDDGNWVRTPLVEASIKYQNPAGRQPGGRCDENGDFAAFVPEASLDAPFDDTQRSWRFTWKRELTDGKIFGKTLADKAFPAAYAAEPVSSGVSGVSYKKVGDGNSILITFAGFTMSLNGSRAWADALCGSALPGVGHAFAVQGPLRGQSYDKSADFKALVDMVRPLGGPHFTEADRVFVVAHSSGAFMAHWFLEKYLLQDPEPVSGRVVYYNVDGGEGLSDGAIKQLAGAYAVYTTCDRGGRSYASRNAKTMVNLGRHYGKVGRGGAIRSDQACSSDQAWSNALAAAARNNNDRWFLHFALINFVQTLPPGAQDVLTAGDDLYKKCTAATVTADYLHEG